MGRSIMKWIVQMYYMQSEASYAFGPFSDEEEVQTFLNKVRTSGNCEEAVISILNSPELFGTGMELS